ncbi:MAG: nucleotidyltransferase family protein [Candidatus Heimdallarchaeota archaeon]
MIKLEQSITDIQRKILPILQKFGVVKASLFGSIVRGEASATSDLDLLVEFSGKKSLFDLVDLKLALEELLHCKVDVLTYNSLHPLIKDAILSEEVVIYG